MPFPRHVAGCCGHRLLGEWCGRNGYAVANGVYYGPYGYYDANLVFRVRGWNW
jgi:hypothetical protein